MVVDAYYTLITIYRTKKSNRIYVAVNLSSQVIFVFLLFLGMLMQLMKLKQRKNKNYPR